MTLFWHRHSCFPPTGSAAHSERVGRGGGHVLLQQAGEWGAHKLALVPTGTPWYVRPCALRPKPNLSVSSCVLSSSGGRGWWPNVQNGLCGEHGPCHGCWKGVFVCFFYILRKDTGMNNFHLYICPCVYICKSLCMCNFGVCSIKQIIEWVSFFVWRPACLSETIFSTTKKMLTCVGMCWMFCIGCCPGWTCCCGVVPGSAGEEQLEGDGLEVGPQWVRPVKWEISILVLHLSLSWISRNVYDVCAEPRRWCSKAPVLLISWSCRPWLWASVCPPIWSRMQGIPRWEENFDKCYVNCHY